MLYTGVTTANVVGACAAPECSQAVKEARRE